MADECADDPSSIFFPLSRINLRVDDAGPDVD